MTREEVRILRSIADEIDHWEFPDAPEMGRPYIEARMDLLERLLRYTRVLRDRADAVITADPAPDPLAHVKVGDPDPTQDDGPYCWVGDADGLASCTRKPGHPGQHIEGTFAGGVVAVWPAQPETETEAWECKHYPRCADAACSYNPAMQRMNARPETGATA